MNTIGLFGTCGSSTWRKEFISSYSTFNIPYFNPQVEEGTWHPGMVADENKHLQEDDIILFPVTSETTSQGSLSEIGFSILASLRRNPTRYFIFMIDDVCVDPDATPAQIKESNRSRALVKSKLKEVAQTNDGVFIVDTMKEMLDLSLKLHSIVVEFNTIKQCKGI